MLRKPKQKFDIPPPSASITLLRYLIGQVFGSIEHWPRLVVALALLIGVWRAKSADLPKILETMSKTLESTAILGWIVAACLLLGSAVVITVVISLYRRELDRIAARRDELQERLLNQKVQRSTPTT